MLLMMTWVYMTQSVVILQRLANVSQIQGQVTFVPKGKTTPNPLGENNKVKEGDLVQTAADSTAVLTWIDGSKVRIGPASELEVKKCFTKGGQEVSLFRLNSGEVWARISKRLRRESEFAIETPAAVAGVRGTVFSVALTPSGGTMISIFDGSVFLQSQKTSLLFTAGTVLDVRSDGETYTAAMTDEEKTQWQRRDDFLGPLLTVSAPMEGETLPAGPIKVTGSTEPRASVLVNGAKAAISRLGHFSAEVSLDPGENSIEIRATDRFTFSTVVRRQVTGTQ